jgi:histidyl-tRNA synthetase
MAVRRAMGLCGPGLRRAWSAAAGPAPERVRGTADVLGTSEAFDLAWVEREGRAAAAQFGFEEARAPLIEPAALFARTLGEGSDVVMKEMFSFPDRSGNALALRPEGTAGLARAVMAQGEVAALLPSAPRGFFYHGPMFRYERPQRGRQRQFTQFGVELLGAEGAAADVQVVALAAELLRRCGLLARCRLLVNSLGCESSRAAFATAVGAHLAAYCAKGQLSEDSRRRVAAGRALRVLDSKDARDAEAVASAPRASEWLQPAALERYAAFRHGLRVLGIEHVEEPRLVRGLDYYSHSIFEFVLDAPVGGAEEEEAKSETKSAPPLLQTPQQQQQQALRPTAVLAGGRYDGLTEALGFPRMPAVGWAAGVERICLERARLGLSLAVRPRPEKVLVVPMLVQQQQKQQQQQQSGELDAARSQAVRDHCLRLCSALRASGVVDAALPWLQAMDADRPISGLLKKAYKAAERHDCSLVAMVGSAEAEAPRGPLAATFKHLAGGVQQRCDDESELRAFLVRSSAAK